MIGAIFTTAGGILTVALLFGYQFRALAPASPLVVAILAAAFLVVGAIHDSHHS